MAQLTSDKSVEPFARLWDLDTDDSDTYKPTVTGTVKIRLEKISDAIILLSNHGGKFEIRDFSGCRIGKNT